MSLRIGDRIAIHPATDLFMRGVRYATVIAVGRKWIRVQADNGRTFQLALDDVVDRIDY